MALTPDQQELLEFERRWPRFNGDKSNAVREYFDLTMNDYERLLDAVLELPSAMDYDSGLVTSVKRQRNGMRWFLERQHGGAQQGGWG